MSDWLSELEQQQARLNADSLKQREDLEQQRQRQRQYKQDITAMNREKLDWLYGTVENLVKRAQNLSLSVSFEVKKDIGEIVLQSRDRHILITIIDQTTLEVSRVNEDMKREIDHLSEWAKQRNFYSAENRFTFSLDSINEDMVSNWIRQVAENRGFPHKDPTESMDTKINERHNRNSNIKGCFIIGGILLLLGSLIMILAQMLR